MNRFKKLSRAEMRKITGGEVPTCNSSAQCQGFADFCDLGTLGQPPTNGTFYQSFCSSGDYGCGCYFVDPCGYEQFTPDPSDCGS